MATKNWLVLLASCVALAAAPVMGCGGDSDPSGSNNVENNGPNNGPGADASGPGDDVNGPGPGPGEDATGPGPGEDATGPGPGEDATGPGPGEDATGPGDDTGDPGPNNPGDACVANTWWNGQAFIPEPDNRTAKSHNGGVAVDLNSESLDAPLADAGLQPIIDAALAVTGSDVVPLASPVQVDGALVIATSFTRKDKEGEEGTNYDLYDSANGDLWLQDANGNIATFALFNKDTSPTAPVRVGDKLKFKATHVALYFGSPQIRGVTDFQVLSSDNQVPFYEMTGEEITEDYRNQLVRVTGLLQAQSDPACANCYDLKHGDKSIQVRTPSSKAADIGKCVTFMGPANVYEGSGTSYPELNVTNWSWYYVPSSRD